jgi:hypothetical protein
VATHGGPVQRGVVALQKHQPGQKYRGTEVQTVSKKKVDEKSTAQRATRVAKSLPTCAQCNTRPAVVRCVVPSGADCVSTHVRTRHSATVHIRQRPATPPTKSRAPMSAPDCSRCSTTERCPLCAARIRAVSRICVGQQQHTARQGQTRDCNIDVCARCCMT